MLNASTYLPLHVHTHAHAHAHTDLHTCIHCAHSRTLVWARSHIFASLFLRWWSNWFFFSSMFSFYILCLEVICLLFRLVICIHVCASILHYSLNQIYMSTNTRTHTLTRAHPRAAMPMSVRPDSLLLLFSARLIFVTTSWRSFYLKYSRTFLRLGRLHVRESSCVRARARECLWNHMCGACACLLRAYLEVYMHSKTCISMHTHPPTQHFMQRLFVHCFWLQYIFTRVVCNSFLRVHFYIRRARHASPPPPHQHKSTHTHTSTHTHAHIFVWVHIHIVASLILEWLTKNLMGQRAWMYAFDTDALTPCLCAGQSM